MSRLNYNNSNYFSLNSGIGYSSVLRHFVHQSEGKAPNILIGHRTMNGRPATALRYIKLGEDQRPEDRPKTDVIDPNEAKKKIAESQLARQVEDKTAEPAGPPHSASSSRKRKIVKSADPTAAKIVKRAIDIFDK